MNFLTRMQNVLGGGVADLAIYLIIVLLFIVALAKCVLPVLRNRSLLKRAIRSTHDGGKGSEAWQKEDFLGRGALSAHWSEYLNNLFFADGVYNDASNVEDYINEESVIHSPGRGSFADAVPGLMVSLGFLGTLIGLADGLAGFSISDSEAALSSIVTLIPGMRYAFMTSIFGVVGSLLFTLITRAVYGSTERTLRAFYSALSGTAGLRSVDPMTQVAIYQQEQTALIQKMVDELTGKMSENLAEAVSRAVEPLNQSFRNFVSVNTRDQMRFLDAVAGRFVDRMEDLLGGQMKRLSRLLDQTIEQQEEALRSVKDCASDTSAMLRSVREVAGVCDGMVRQNAEYIDKLRESQKQTDDAFARVASSVEQMDLVSRQQANYLKSVSAMHADVARSTDQMTSALANFTDRLSEQSANASTGLLKAAAELRATGAQLEEIHRGCAASITNELKLTLEAYQDYVNQFTQRVDYLAAGIADALKELPAAVDDSANHLLDQVDRLTDSMAKAQRALSDAAARLYDDARAR